MINIESDDKVNSNCLILKKTVNLSSVNQMKKANISQQITKKDVLKIIKWNKS